MILKKFIVHGSIMEYMACLDCLATSKDDAIDQWKAAFTPEQLGGMIPKVWEQTTEKWEEGHKFYSGGYTYY